ncbi:hypothetical protein D1007_34500 [Hordeum vulgare]|nr:hypothetical protein D1007_34500 [Hordeum vulgare]
MGGDLENPLAAARAEQRSRCRKLWWGHLLYAVILVASSVLIAYFQVYVPGPAVYLASRVIGYAGLAVSVCWGLFLVHQWDLFASEEQRIIDTFM